MYLYVCASYSDQFILVHWIFESLLLFFPIVYYSSRSGSSSRIDCVHRSSEWYHLLCATNYRITNTVPCIQYIPVPYIPPPVAPPNRDCPSSQFIIFCSFCLLTSLLLLLLFKILSYWLLCLHLHHLLVINLRRYLEKKRKRFLVKREKAGICCSFAIPLFLKRWACFLSIAVKEEEKRINRRRRRSIAINLFLFKKKCSQIPVSSLQVPSLFFRQNSPSSHCILWPVEEKNNFYVCKKHKVCHHGVLRIGSIGYKHHPCARGMSLSLSFCHINSLSFFLSLGDDLSLRWHALFLLVEKEKNS